MNNLKRLSYYTEYHHPLQGRECSSHIDFIYKIGCIRRLGPSHCGSGLFSLFRRYAKASVNIITIIKSTHCIPITYRAMHILALCAAYVQR